MKEKVATLIVLFILAAVPGAVMLARRMHADAICPPAAKVFNITAVGAGSGAYTLENVNGLNYWWKRFAPMTLTLNVGDRVVLNLTSADVSHQFYVPFLDIGPVDVLPGKHVMVEFTADRAGVYQYFCTTMCGQCHCFMTGWIIVAAPGKPPETPDPIVCPVCFADFERPQEVEMVRLGDYLYLEQTCNACHGWEGQGGVKNPNYAKKTIPAHNTTANKLFLRSAEDADRFIELVQQNGGDLDDLDEDLDIPMFNVVKARFQALKQIIANGSPPQKLDPDGPEPPLWMPAWRHKLTQGEMDALIVFFVDLFPWDEDEEEETG